MTNDELIDALESKLDEWRTNADELMHERADELDSQFVRGRGAQQAQDAFEIEQLLEEFTDE